MSICGACGNFEVEDEVEDEVDFEMEDEVEDGVERGVEARDKDKEQDEGGVDENEDAQKQEDEDRYAGGISDGSGANRILEWNGLYFFNSTDSEDDGPFDSLEEALNAKDMPPCGAGSCIDCEYDSEEMLALAQRFIGSDEDGAVIWINNAKYVTQNGKVTKIAPPTRKE